MPDRITKDLVEAAADLRIAIGRLVRRMRQGYVAGEATLSESSVLSRLDRDGPSTPGYLAEQERVKPQAMGATLAGLVERGLVSRSPDAADGRRVLMSVTATGRKLLTDRRSLSTQRVAQALAGGFTAEERHRLLEVIPLLERLADEL
ncbi:MULTISPECIES: MarR family winged helix-turn-helix transcriptional regulator [unclassified Amycolatopsis]|uniref:MarR family winged helix-turn-helix transcriptional regulator n=1 Tax=unclassified Amycolatopsis TaxID=2618356 RepID=UPI001C69712B|nr:MarR family transcriptional regulator [Amycolatopsis sp. DSM 110486]QYN19816.1 MarR family transcriptional regulator [Amycolatopsis sp. DSM 110486]